MNKQERLDILKAVLITDEWRIDYKLHLAKVILSDYDMTKDGERKE